MVRTLEFDYTDALERATRLFWKTGYSNTSLRDLLRQMGIGEGSFYNTLKSKKNAYLECLKHYNSTVNRRRGELLFSAPTAALGIRAVFKDVLDCLDDPETPAQVCLMAGSVTREVLAEPELCAYVQQQMSMFIEGIVERLTVDKNAGLLPESSEPQLLGPILVTHLQGLWRMALIGYDRPRFERQIELLLSSVGL